ncbi:hypothetical protein GW950_01855 [Candidatus Wolfebacteria bacterium]|nr:hypothetical protein [Candidatus Wolfebacteria bacterium]
MSTEFIKNKAREISYALIRVSFYIKRDDLRSRMEKLSFELLENASRLEVEKNNSNLNKSLETVSALDGLVRLAHSIYELEPVNATVLVRELDSLDSAMRQLGNANKELSDIESFFNVKQGESLGEERKEIKNIKEENRDEEEKGVDTEFSPRGFNRVNVSDFSLNGEEDEEVVATPIKSDGGGSINAAIRQSAIISKVKAGNGHGFRLKEIISDFPDVSERTLRYDLQRLCRQGVLERVGNGGPSSYYRYAN